MDNKLNNEVAGVIRNILESLTNILHKYKLPQDADTDEVADKANADILNALKEEHDVITKLRKIKQLFPVPGGQDSVSTDTGVHDKEPFNAQVAGTTVENNCFVTPRNSNQETEEGMAMPSEDRHAYNIDEYSSKENNFQSTGHHENNNYLCNLQKSTNDEDILVLMTSDDDGDRNSFDDIAGTNSIAVDDDTSLDNPVTQEQEDHENIDNINSETDINNLSKQHFYNKERKESKENKRSKNQEGTRNDDRYCFSYLKTKTCNYKPECNFRHDFPSRDTMDKILKKLSNPLVLSSSESLKRRYGDCFAKAFSQRGNLKELLTITMEFLQHSPKDKITDRIINTTLNYFNKHNKDINLTLYKNILLKNISPEKQVYMKLIERVSIRNIKNDDDFNSFKRVCLLLTNFIINNIICKISTTEILMNKICDVKYDQCLAEALINVMRLTSAEIFRNPAIQHLELFIKHDSDVYRQYLQLKEAREKKNDDVKNDNIVPHVEHGLSVFTSTSTSNNLQNSSNANNETTNITEDDFCHPSPIVSEHLHDSTIMSHENIDDITMRDDDERSNNNSRHRRWCFFNILNRCTKRNCSLRHDEPDEEGFKYLLNHTKQEKLFAMTTHQPTVKKYGKYLAEHFVEQNSTKQLVMLTVECLKLADIKPDTTTKVMNITFDYFNRPDIDVRLCERLKFKIKMKSVQSLLLSQLLSNEDLAQSTNALIFLIDLISSSKETFSYSVAESILKTVCSSRSTNLARAFIKVIPDTHPKIHKHSLITDFEELLATDKDLLEKYNALKPVVSGDVHSDQISDETTSILNVNEDDVSQKSRRTRSTEERSVNTKSAHLKVAASIKRRRLTNHNLEVQAPGPNHVVPPLQHKKPVKINPCQWAPRVTPLRSDSKRNQQKNSQAESP